MTKILLLGAQHGNELLGKQLYHHITRRRPDLLPFIVYKTGNLKAFKEGVRYIESDLNRSYTGRRRTYEERRANQILRYITYNHFDIVLDLHTTTCVQPPCFITAGLTDMLKNYLRASSIQRIVQINHSIVMTSLIGVCPQAISIEVNKDEALTDGLLDSLCDDIERYAQRGTGKPSKRIYYVNDLLLKSEISQDKLALLKNFQRAKDGFYPILVGENSYKKQTRYLGFKAYETKRLYV